MLESSSTNTGRAVLTVNEVCGFVGFSRKTFYAEVNAGRIPLRKIANKSVVLRGDIDAYIANLPLAKANPGSQAA